jgi:hypothetical protein
MGRIEKANNPWLLSSLRFAISLVAMLDALLWHAIALTWSRSLLLGEKRAKYRADTERRASMA